jgi:DNA-binding SARP family transcriptional activator
MSSASSRVLVMVMRGEYEAGWALHGRLRSPSSDDDRWAGLCLFNLGRPLEARALLIRAVGQGCAPARIELATVYRQLGEPELGRQTLQGLVFSRLSFFDQSLAERELGVSRFTFGDLRGAYEALERAWTLAARSDAENTLLPGIGLTLGYVCMAQGMEARALHFLGGALKYARGLRQRQLQTLTGACLTYSGRFQEAEQTFAQIPGVEGPGTPTRLYHQAVLARFQGRTREALALFQASSAQARQLEEPDTECHAELGICAVQTELEDPRQAARALARASALHAPERVTALVELRRGQLQARLGIAGASDLLTVTLERFRRLQLHRERGWAALHLAEAYLAQQQPGPALEAIEEANLARAALAGSPAIALELRALPRVLALLQEEAYPQDLRLDWQALQGQPPLFLQIQTFGEARLMVDGRSVRPNASLDKCTELLVYLLIFPDRTLSQVLAAIFPEKHKDAARIYVHLMRSELARIIPGLSLPFDRATKTYRIDVGSLRVQLDLNELKHGLYGTDIERFGATLHHYRGAFLPEADTDWAVEERTNVEWLIVRTGLETLEEYYLKGENALCLELAERLLEVAPLNEAINTMLIRATERLKGAVAARHTLERVHTRFRQEVGEVPLALEWTVLDLGA